MTDRVYPAAPKPAPPPGAAATTTATTNGAAKTTQLYNPNRPRPVYRPPQSRRRSCSCRRFCCLCFLYTLITLLCLLLIAAIAACIFYVFYHPKHPTFAVTSIRTTAFNLTTTDPAGFSRLASHLDFTLTAKNPNKKNIVFVYDPFAAAVELAGGNIDAGNATLPGFTHVAGNTTILRGTVISDPTRSFDSDSVAPLRADLAKKNGFPLTVEANTMVQVQIGKLKTKRVGIRVTCPGIRGFQPKNAKSKTPTPATATNAKCKVDLRIKIWKFTF